MDSSDLLLNTDYPIDQYVCYSTGSVTASSGGGFSTTTVAHGLGYAPLLYIQWSETSDFSTPRELLQNPSDLYSNAEPWVIRGWADATNVSFYFQNWGGSSKTIYFRAWGLAPSNVSADVPHTSGVSGLSNFILNTDMNYLKLYMEGRVVVSSAPTSVTHDLGYLPVVMVWVEDGTIGGAGSIAQEITPVLYIQYGPTNATDVTTSELIFNDTGTYHYRIYLEPIYG